MDLKKSVSIIIPNYNGKKLLEQYLPCTITAIEAENAPFEIIVVDDASSDGSVEFLKQFFPQVLVIQNKLNKGFSYSCNIGLEAAKYELSFFLNSDVKLDVSYFSKQWKYFEFEDTFGVMGRMLTPEGNRIEGAAKIPILSGLKLKVNKQYYSNNLNQKSTPTIFLSGANSLVVTEKAREIGGFNEIFSPFYSEDVDLGLKSWRVGWKSYYEHQSICYHLGSHTIKNSCQKKKIKSIYYRNRMILHGIHVERKDLPLWKIQLLLLEILPKLLIGDFWIFKSFLDYRKQIKNIEDSRKSLQILMDKHERKISILDLEEYFEKSLFLQNPTFL
ncbi:glycosyltransferase family 2 protein [Aquiflexum sp. TKW24L]|uniref:glycosyltransferase family 2 protein n=1 Tax=Aquiflexum sp. TKW24L TaxID=2942212 RepID=UPI0020BDB57C|nr:glycosyltransferase family 2 protein [Aquiflexum sp. TKW24L]MCL6258250.1 glycosyltransferase family 2 protein [Aquiflexum sp. TKW24L]